MKITIKAQLDYQKASIMINLDRYKNDLQSLIKRGEKLVLAMHAECSPIEFKSKTEKMYSVQKSGEILKDLPSFKIDYQAWYTEAKVIVKLLLPDRFADFVRHYEAPKLRKELDFGNYMIEDYLQGVRVTTGPQQELVVDRKAAIPRFIQQLAIL